jgi:hypothetical protein
MLPILHLLLLLLLLLLAASGPELTGIARLPADTFLPGPPSGGFLDPANGRTPPFPGQPAQGISALLPLGPDDFLALSDNGFGSPANSGDYLLRVYRLRPSWRTAQGGEGTMDVATHFTLADPRRQVPFPLVCDRETYARGEASWPVDVAVRRGRLLTGADFDPESFRRLPDGTFWFGDEIGPWLLHTDSAGIVLEPPVAIPGVHAPRNPTREDTPTAQESGGVEALALTPSGLLVALIEKPLEGATALVNAYFYDPRERAFVGSAPSQPAWRYRLDEGATGVTALTALAERRFLVLERDDAEGPRARVKRLYRIDLDHVEDGVPLKTLVLDLLAIPDPHHVGDTSGVFPFPFVTPESVALLDERTIAIVNDNNYPMSRGRDPREIDGTELVRIRFSEPL